MVERQLRARDIRDPAVLSAMLRTPRHEFVPGALRDRAYEDCPLPIACGQTISQPYIVAKNAELLQLRGEEKVLEVGAGSGYQAAVLAPLTREIYVVEWFEALATSATQVFASLDLSNITVKQGDGKLGWPEAAPFDRILVSCAVKEIPAAWEQQLVEGGLLVFPKEERGEQWLCRWRRGAKGWASEETLFSVRFVPLL